MNMPFACDNALLSTGVFCRINASEAEPGSASSFPHCHLFTFRCHSLFALLLLGKKVTQISKCFFTSCNLGWVFMWLNFSQDPESPPVFWIHQVEPCLTLFFPLSHLSSTLSLQYTNAGEASKTAGLAVYQSATCQGQGSDFFSLEFSDCLPEHGDSWRFRLSRSICKERWWGCCVGSLCTSFRVWHSGASVALLR